MRNRHAAFILVTSSACNTLLYNPIDASGGGSGGSTSPSEGSTTTDAATTQVVTSGESATSASSTSGASESTTSGHGASTSGGSSGTTEPPPPPDPCKPDMEYDNPGDGCIAGEPVRLIFVTSQVYSGDLGGLEGADGFCTDLAKAAGFKGHFRAWLSSSVVSVRTRMEDSPLLDMDIDNPRRIVRPYNEEDQEAKLVAGGWVEFTNGWWLDNKNHVPSVMKTLENRIRVTENGSKLSDDELSWPFWSAVFPDGESIFVDKWLDTNVRCMDWTSNVHDVSLIGLTGDLKMWNANWSWSLSGGARCDEERRLVCLQYDLEDL